MKTKTRAELLLASKNAATGVILYTWRLTFPHIILSEVNTYRVASRNTSSSRAIPSKKMRAAVLHDPFVPISLGRNQKGMQAGAEITGISRLLILLAWKLGRYPAVFLAWLLEALGAHKQVANRVLEPWSWCTQIFSTTEIDNLLAQRNHDAAEPHFHELARQMQKQAEIAQWLLCGNGINFPFIVASGGISYVPVRTQILQPGEWHLPLVDLEDYEFDVDAIRVSVARCARTSYTLIETGKKSTADADIKLCEGLASSGHYSPFEHQARAMHVNHFSGNFRSFSQYRKEIEDGQFDSGLVASA